MSLSEDDLMRFTSKIEYTDTCWLWTGTCNGGGYGLFHANKTTYCTHRLALEVHLGRPLLPGMVASHAPHSVCGHRNCVNPAHLREATYQENAADKKVDDTAQFGVRHPMAKLTENQIYVIYNDTRTYDTIAAEHGISRQHVYRIKAGKLWKHLIQAR